MGSEIMSSHQQYCPQNMGKVKKVRGKYEKTKHPKVKCFLHILGEAKIHTIPKIWEKRIPIIREKYGKKQTFQSNGFHKYFG